MKEFYDFDGLVRVFNEHGVKFIYMTNEDATEELNIGFYEGVAVSDSRKIVIEISYIRDKVTERSVPINVKAVIPDVSQINIKCMLGHFDYETKLSHIFDELKIMKLSKL